MDFSSTENGNPVYNGTNSPYYDPGSPLAEAKELKGPAVSARLINGATAWGNGSATEDKNRDLTAYIHTKPGRAASGLRAACGTRRVLKPTMMRRIRIKRSTSGKPMPKTITG